MFLKQIKKENKTKNWSKNIVCLEILYLTFFSKFVGRNQIMSEQKCWFKKLDSKIFRPNIQNVVQKRLFSQNPNLQRGRTPYHTRLQTYKKTVRRPHGKMTSPSLASQSCTELGPTQPQLFQ